MLWVIKKHNKTKQQTYFLFVRITYFTVLTGFHHFFLKPELWHDNSTLHPNTSVLKTSGLQEGAGRRCCKNMKETGNVLQSFANMSHLSQLRYQDLSLCVREYAYMPEGSLCFSALLVNYDYLISFFFLVIW